MNRLTTDAELADLLGISVADVRNGARTKGWPCVKPKRGVWRFTDQHVEQIVAMSSRAAGRPAVKKATGQSARSASRAS